LSRQECSVSFDPISSTIRIHTFLTTFLAIICAMRASGAPSTRGAVCRRARSFSGLQCFGIWPFASCVESQEPSGSLSLTLRVSAAIRTFVISTISTYLCFSFSVIRKVSFAERMVRKEHGSVGNLGVCGGHIAVLVGSWRTCSTLHLDTRSPIFACDDIYGGEHDMTLSEYHCEWTWYLSSATFSPRYARLLFFVVPF